MSTSGITRYFGLSGSGLDIDLMVSNLMKAQRAKQDKIKQNKTIAEWQKEQYRDINNSLRSLRDNVFAMKLQGTYQVKKATSSNEGIVKASASNMAVLGTQDIKVYALAGSARLNSSEAVSFDASKTGLQEQLGLTGADPIAFTINGKEVNIDPSLDTIDNLVGKINNAGAGVTAFFDKALSRMFISSNSTGAGATVDFDDVANAGELFHSLKLDGNPDAGITDPFAAVNGTDAAFELNGTLLHQATNQFTIAGVSYTLSGTSTSETVHVNVANDTDAVYNSINTFVELYNTTIDKLNSILSEKRDKNYLPLTDEEREELTEKQIEQWEKTAKTGLLRSDILLTKVVSNMRSTLVSFVSGIDSDYNSLASIGITTHEYTEKGKLHVNETDLKKAISSDLNGVMELFTRSSDVEGERGLAMRLYDDLNTGINQLIDKAGSDDAFSAVDNSALSKKIADYEDQINSWDYRLQKMEARYYAQFTAMETALYKMNMQSQWLAQMFGSNNS